MAKDFLDAGARRGQPAVDFLLRLSAGGTLHTGSYYKGTFVMNAGSPEVNSGDDKGAVAGPTDGLGLYQNIVADLDITGNVLTLGSWAGDPTHAHAGMALQYSEAFTLPGAAQPSAAGNKPPLHHALQASIKAPASGVIFP